MLCWQWYTCTKCLVVTITTFKMRGVAMRYYCDLWPVNSGVRTVTSYILLAGMEINNPHALLASFQPIQLLAQEEGAWVTQGTRRLGTRLTNPQASWPGSQGQYCSCEKHIGHSHTVKPCYIRVLVLAEIHVLTYSKALLHSCKGIGIGWNTCCAAGSFNNTQTCSLSGRCDWLIVHAWN